ncbi:VOC family protein [Vibrio coralliilyticus]|uniref:VOC family protein n=1 Tax=Vibrio coralliilyticus TaxID=190893 RepID=UPI0006CD4D8E|nr:VOC family protein [Vibrio coralliilyticus]AXN34014.1 VOC family protein [Vibrio coralliilyticus]KPH24448.1 glyoxalase [Vibrio coralliilyticus]NOI27372.1 VOC family protein [Vibrio coralliilyticus]NOI46337.1 VOC family protein [Vibrio coralliilyticus]
MEPRISIITLGVSNLKTSFDFYTKLGLESAKTPEEGIIFFKTRGTCLALYPLEALADDVSPDFAAKREGFSGITLAHNTRSKDEVDEVLRVAVEAGGKLEKPAQDVFWGGYSGYFSDPDGYLWEVAYGDCWEFNEDGSLVI